MTDGLKDAHRAAIISVLAANKRVERAVLFGSRATETFTQGSDVDIALFGKALTIADLPRLTSAIDELTVPQRIDLLLYDRIDNETLREHIQRDGIEWYGKREDTAKVQLHLQLEHYRTLKALLRKHLPGVEVWAYGSRVDGRSHDGSDLDLILRGPGLNEIPILQLGDFEEAVRESSIPFLVEARDWAHLPERFHRKIKRNHVVFIQGTAYCSSSNSWRNMAFSEAVQVNPKVRLERGRTYPFVDMASVNSNSRCAYASMQREYTSGGSRFYLGDTLMARITPCLENGKIARYCSKDKSESAYGSTEFIVVRGRPDVTDTAFSYYLTRWEKVRQYAVDQMTGTSGRQRVPVESLDHLQVPIPPLPQQRAIAYILGTLDDKIELNRRMNETLEAIGHALFKSWFVDFEPVRAKMAGRNPGLPQPLAELFPARLVNVEVGEIPEGWEVSPIGEEVSAVGGGTPSTKETVYWSEGIHSWATPKDLAKLASSVLLETERKITEAGLKRISSGLLPAGTVLLSSRAPIGYLAITEMPVAVNQGFIAMVCRKRLSNIFVFFWCHENLDYIKSISGGSTFSEISKKIFRPIPVTVPPREVLKAYDDVARPLFGRIVANTKEANSLAQTRDALLPKLISGEIGVTDTRDRLETLV